MSQTLYPPHSSLKPGARVIAYLRDSGGTNQETSIDRQESEVRRWCAQYGLILTAVYTDEARSAHTSLHKRKDLLSLMAYLRNGAEEKAVIIWNYERFARNIKHGRQYIAEIEALDKYICSLTDNIPEGPERYFMQDLKLWSAEQTSVKISIDVASGLRGMVETHGGMPGTPPRGFIRGEPVHIGKHRDGSPRIVRKWVPDPSLIEAVRMAFDMRARGATVKQIMHATRLYPTINSYKTFFANRIYMGILEYGDIVIEDYCPPIVTPEIWEKANEVSRERARINPHHEPRRYASSFLLSGILFCQHCGSRMNGHVVKKRGQAPRMYYACMRSMRRRDCPARKIPAIHFERAIIARLDELSKDIGKMLQFQARVKEHYKKMMHQADGERRRLRRELSEQVRRINNLTESIATHGGSNALHTALHNAEVKHASLKMQIDQLENNNIPPEDQTPQKLETYSAQVRAALNGDDPDQKKHAIHMLTVRIIALRTEWEVNSVLYYLPSVCIGQSAPTEEITEDIHFAIVIPKYSRR